MRGIGARVSRTGGVLAVTYIIEGDLDRVRLPAPQAPSIADRLWEHTCCEIFIARNGEPRYYEFNLSSSGEWAAYLFERYRERVPLDNLTALDPELAVRRTSKKLELDALIPLDRLSPAHADGALALGLAVVIENQDRSLSYWALRHPPGKPDFHHHDAFALTLE